ncbi:helix-turn-helix domain-containing protein [Rhizobium deserti]|uniref:helix-turn-helix domain-containing protein n=1 Tax=Rhizobium deserti TaxID=2547961 RepID=UPI001386A1CD|nr:helix-turn-helix domain-containing protein [Rhizobium deserti]
MALIDQPQEEQFDGKEAAKRLGISVKTLMRHVKDGAIRYINIGTKERKRLRFTPYILKQFQHKQQKREKPQCQSTSPQAPLITIPNSSSKVIAFTSLQKPKPKKKPS